MRRKIVMTLAMSLDGYIASENGAYDWIVGDGKHELDTAYQWRFEQFLENVDLVVMGKNCYDQQMHKDFQGKTVWVASHSALENEPGLEFISGDIVQRVVQTASEVTGKDIYLFGGGKLMDAFIKADVIDSYIIGIIPVILGSGKPLFYSGNPMLRLTLDNYAISEGMTILHYSRAKAENA